MMFDSQAAGIAVDLVPALRRYGFATLELPQEQVARAFDLARRFYAMPLAKRLEAAAFVTNGVLGYYPSESVATLVREQHGLFIPTFEGKRARGYCSFDFIANEEICRTSKLLRENRWPIDDGFRTEACAVYESLGKLSSRTCSAMIEHLAGAEKLRCLRGDAFDGACCSLMRLLKYSVQGSQSLSKPHTDYEFATFIIADGEGLEVCGSDGDWRSAFAPNAAIVLPGDMLELASSGSIRSALHRVRFGSAERHSVVFFQGLRLDQEIASAAEERVVGATFGQHLSAMLVRGAAHLQQSVGEWEDALGVEIPMQNPFRLSKHASEP